MLLEVLCHPLRSEMSNRVWETSQRHASLLRWVRSTRWRQTSPSEGVLAEKKLLATVNCKIDVTDVRVGPTPNHYMHTLVGGIDGQPPVVWMPGYAAGTGFFYRNFEGLCNHFKLYSVDWLGTGLSGRPKFTARSRQEAEDFFTDSLSAWRAKAGLDKFILVGHSLGGYLAAQYALKYPEQIEHLVLVCPAGVPQAPEDWEKRVLGSGRSLRGSLFRFGMWAWKDHHFNLFQKPFNSLSADNSLCYLHLFSCLEQGVTPGAIIRGLGPWGPNLVKKYVSARFQHHEGDKEEVNMFSEYMYSILAERGSGEYALRHLLAPGAWAHAPLAESLKELKVPVTFIYGESDWMKPQHAVDLVRELRALRQPRVPSDLTVAIIPNSGHFAFLDDAEAFNKAMLLALKPYLGPKQRALAQAAASAGTAAKTAGSLDGRGGNPGRAAGHVGGPDADGGTSPARQ